MLGKLKKGDLREVWKHEAHEFTHWLAEEENIRLLGEEVGIEMEVLKTEADVGSFSVDILAQETNTNKKIIIENQLEVTNHDHLGKLITYASGLEANYIIWIFKDIRDEHKNAINWLNEISNGEVGFFAIQMELWQINDSEKAPKFNVIVSPNDWAKAIRDSQTNNALTENNLFQLDYWKGFSDFLKEKGAPFRVRKPRAQHWYDLSIGSSQAHLSLIVSVRENFIRIDLYIDDNKSLFRKLHEHKQEIEDKLGFGLDWQELPNAKASRIAIRKDVKDIKKKDEIHGAYEWYLENCNMIARVFQDYLKIYSV